MRKVRSRSEIGDARQRFSVGRWWNKFLYLGFKSDQRFRERLR